MRLIMAGLLCLACHAASPADRTPDEAGERAALAGTWRGFAVEGKGEKPDQGPVKLELTITQTGIHGIEIKGDDRVDHGRGEYTLNLGVKPGQLDATGTNERGRKTTWVGIYRLEGDTLYWCTARRERPTTFQTVKGQFLLILKRDKPSK